MHEVSALDEARTLLESRNPALGALLTAERGLAYLEILLVLARFRDHHELEPLHDDILAALGSHATPTLFNQDIRQLDEWGLISQRIEKERLRGYRDTRRRKFRYRISEDALSFLLWLQTRRQEDLEPSEIDTRDLLADMVAGLREAARQINRLSLATIDYEGARPLFHRLARLKSTTEDVARSLAEFNIRLLAFAGGAYEIENARRIVQELERFLERFLRRIHILRREIVPEIAKLRHPRLAARWEACAQVMRIEAAATRSLMRMRMPAPDATLAALASFYGRNGELEQLASRVNASALLVWQKLHSHLRELERRSHRLEDLRQRIKEIAALDPLDVPRAWLLAMLQPAQMRADMHEWTAEFKAIPPQPVWARHQVRDAPPEWLPPHPTPGDKPAQSVEEKRIEQLADWMRAHGVMPSAARSVPLSAARVEEVADFQRLMEIMRGGLLNRGRRLRRLSLHLEKLPQRVELTTPEASLDFDDHTLSMTHRHEDD